MAIVCRPWAVTGLVLYVNVAVLSSVLSETLLAAIELTVRSFA